MISDPVALSPFPDLDDDTAVTRSGPAGEQVLLGSRCRVCTGTWFPPRPVCPTCSADEPDEYPIGPAGTLYTFSTVHVSSLRETPYVLGYVDTAQGVRVLAEIRGPGELRIDSPCTLVLDDDSGSWWFATQEEAR